MPGADGGILDPEREITLDDVLATLELPYQRFRAEPTTGSPAGVVDLTVNGVRVTVMLMASSRASSGHLASLKRMRRARQPGIAVVWHLLRNREAAASQIFVSVILPICVHLRNLRTRLFESSRKDNVLPRHRLDDAEIPEARSVQPVDTAGPMFDSR